MTSRAGSARVRVALARALEEGTWDGPAARALDRAWSLVAARSIARPLAWPEGVRVVAVGGATLGGSGKTPLAIACARALAARGAGAPRVAFVAHGYLARPGAARVVRSDDDVRVVGDEALLAARALAGAARVVVASSRQAALDLAATLADVVVLDGVLQTAPRRAARSLLALDGESPWGAGRVVPRGDLRAPPGALVDACDAAVLVGAEETFARAISPAPGALWSAAVRSRGAYVASELVPWSSLARLRTGLFVALARPARLLAALARHGVVPHRVVRVPDHGVPPAATSRLDFDRSVQVWLASTKCAVHLEAAGIPHARIEHEIVIGGALRAALHRV